MMDYSFLLIEIKIMGRQWSRGEKWLMLGSGIMCLPMLIGSWVYERQNELPPAPIHKQEVPPADNAFDGLLQAIAAAPPLPWAVRTKNGCAATNVDLGDTCDNTYPQPLPYTPQYNAAFPLKQKAPFLKTARKSLNLWRNSLSQPLYVPSSVPDAQERLWNSRNQLLGLVSIQSRASWQRGDNGDALDWLLDLHRDICRSSCSFSNLGHRYVFHIKFSTLEKQRLNMFSELELLSPYLDAVQSRRAALQLQKNRAKLPSRVQILKHAKSIAIEQFYSACKGAPNRFSPTGKKLWKFRWANKKSGLAHIERQWDWLIEQEKFPLAKQYFRYLRYNVIPKNVYMKEDDPFWDLSFQNRPLVSEHLESLKINAREVVWETAMAVRAFALDNGRNPRNLNELVPRYLTKVENDPFDPAHQLRYSPTPKTYVQWFQGKSVFTKKMPPNAVAFPQVAGGAYSPYPQSGPPPTGYYVIRQARTLPFVLYSVGENGRADGGMDFKGVSKKPTSAGTNSGSFLDDVVAPMEWFQKPTLSDHPKISLGPFAA